MPPGSSYFAHDPALINAKFGAYKIANDESTDAVREASFSLPGEVAGASDMSNSQQVGYKQLKDWANIPHLVSGVDPGQAAFLSKQGFFILVVLDEVRMIFVYNCS